MVSQLRVRPPGTEVQGHQPGAKVDLAQPMNPLGPNSTLEQNSGVCVNTTLLSQHVRRSHTHADTDMTKHILSSTSRPGFCLLTDWNVPRPTSDQTRVPDLQTGPTAHPAATAAHRKQTRGTTQNKSPVYCQTTNFAHTSKRPS